MSPQRWTIGASPIHGRGVLMAMATPMGAVIGLSHWFDGHAWNCTELGAFHNHSRTPSAKNVRIDGRRFLVALRDLAPGEEVTVDYRLQPDLEQPAASWL
jgi:hypothetical protein